MMARQRKGQTFPIRLGQNCTYTAMVRPPAFLGWILMAILQIFLKLCIEFAEVMQHPYYFRVSRH